MIAFGLLVATIMHHDDK
ncbi:hypothetical protein [Schleiferilactobacillus harbinensis]|uniref:Uncharacterized protein n=1 Tax=Schleiferilactobacillus harbinensis TaxID=304207 RepID=A0ABU7SYY0_9LACO|nr:hypothetical protein [Schleiferilactobacillus harbinensis]MCI1686773.1 hypothetical protein [Schleiferilactobacillus harbinensis]MCI1782648.1 hypothetical protein [Schleiferilactobacillus harbinensis]MCI1849592.1 hypothetical protein [Schleiferilactobacillus harbinensis]